MAKKKAKVIDIDEFLQEQGVTIRLNGKEYFIDDIPQEVQDILTDPEQDNRKAIAVILGIPEEEVMDFGVVKCAAIINQIYENLLSSHVSPKEA